MGTGGWLDPPSHFCGWCRAKLKWIEPILLAKYGEYLIKRIEDNSTQSLYKIPIPIINPSSQEYFLLENRQKVGFDSALPGSGLLIWHISDLDGYVDLEEADGQDDLYYGRNKGDSGDPYYQNNKTTLGDDTYPDSKSYDGGFSGVKIKVVSPSEPEMRFKFYPHCEYGSTSQVYRGNMSELREKQAFIDAPGIASGIYLYTYVRDVRADIKFKYVYDSQPLVIVESNGWSFANPNQGPDWAKVVSYEKSSAGQYFGCTVQTAVYYVGYNIPGEYIGKWYPCEPSQITFNYVIIGSSIAENTYRTFQYTYSENSMDISDGVGCWSTGEGRDETRYLSPPSGYNVYENTWDKIPTGANRYSGDIGTYIDEANNRLVINYHVDAVFWCPASNFNWRYYVYGRKPTEGTPVYPIPSTAYPGIYGYNTTRFTSCLACRRGMGKGFVYSKLDWI
jgi:hypothetical protein